MGFWLFVLVTGTLLTRPTELVPELRSVELYRWLLFACIGVSFMALFAQFDRRNEGRPITVCVLGLWLCVVLSHLTQGAAALAAEQGLIEFPKNAFVYLLLVGVVNSVRRFRIYVFWLLFFLTIMTILSLLGYFEFIMLSDLSELVDRVKVGAISVEVKRLRGPGLLFGDPNDVGSLFVFGFLLALPRLLDRSRGPSRLMWLGPMGLFLWALYLTHSRGALLGLLCGLAVLTAAKLGWRRMLAIAVVVLPVLFLIGGRAADFSTGKGTTSQQRVQVWSEGLQMYKEAPVFGIGANEFGPNLAKRLNMEDRKGLIAHNSYLQAFTELGFFGGALFAGAFYFALTLLSRPTDPQAASAPDLERNHLEYFRPYLLTAIAGYAGCLFSLSLNYLATTYIVLGLATVHMRLALEAAPAPVPTPRLNGPLMKRLAGVGVGALAFIYVFIRVFGRFS
jgi:hypothetical protein